MLIRLPWRWDGLTPELRDRLKRLGLGGDLPRERLASPGRRALARGLTLGAAASTLALAVLAWLRPSTPPLLPSPGTEPVPHALMADGPHDGRWRIGVISPGGLNEQAAPAGTRIGLQWATQGLPCISLLESPATAASNSGQRWRCGQSLPQQRLAGPAIPRSLALLWATPGTPGVDTLADRLISGGSVDQVLLIPPVTGRGMDPVPFIGTAEHTQLLLFGGPDTRPARALAATPAPKPGSRWRTGLPPLAAWPSRVCAPCVSASPMPSRSAPLPPCN